MKIAVSSTGPTLDAEVDPRFGRAAYLLIVDTDSLDFEAIQNPNVVASHGAGITTAQMVADKQAEVVLTGNCGPNAHNTLGAAGVKVITGVSGVVREAVAGFKQGKLNPSAAPNVAGHFGTGGAGMGGGMGMGRGMGMRNPMGQGMGGGAFQPPQQPMSKEQEVNMLKAQSEAIRKQLGEIDRRLKELSD